MYAYSTLDPRVLPPSPPPPSIPEQTFKKEVIDWRLTMQECYQHIQTNPGRLPMTEKYEEIRTLWLDTHYTRTIAKGQVSENDLLFVLMCYLYCCDRPEVRHRTVVCAEVATRVRIMASQHVECTWPTAIEVRELFEDCACLIVLEANWLMDPEDEIEEGKIKAETLAKYNALHLLPVNEEQREAALKARAKKEKTNLGAIYNSDYTNLSGVFVPLCNRVFGKIQYDAEILGKYPLRTDVCMAPAWRKNVENWLKVKSQTSFEDLFTIRWRNLAMNHLIPMGAHSQVLRNEATSKQVLLPMFVMEKEIGVDTTAAMGEKLDVNKTIIAADPTHEFYDALLLGTIAHLMDGQYKCGEVELETLAKNKVGFLKCFYIENALLHREVERLEDAKRNYMKPRRPLITKLERRWYVHNKKHWILCKDFVEAWLVWCYLLKTEYSSELDDNVNISKFLNLFIPN